MSQGASRGWEGGAIPPDPSQTSQPDPRPDHDQPARAFMVDSPALYPTRHVERSAMPFGVLVCLDHLAPRSVVLG